MCRGIGWTVKGMKWLPLYFLLIFGTPYRDYTQLQSVAFDRQFFILFHFAIFDSFAMAIQDGKPTEGELFYYLHQLNRNSEKIRKHENVYSVLWKNHIVMHNKRGPLTCTLEVAALRSILHSSYYG